jgi:hypothetical protein
MIRLAITLSLIASNFAAPLAFAKPGDEQEQVRKELRKGNVHTLTDIENFVVPQMSARGMEYLGSGYDESAMVYRLRFIRNGQVYFVDVDARTRQIIARH